MTNNVLNLSVEPNLVEITRVDMLLECMRFISKVSIIWHVGQEGSKHPWHKKGDYKKWQDFLF